MIAGCVGTRTTESTGHSIDGSATTAMGKAAILEHRSLKVFDINGETFNAVVPLSGFMNSAEIRSRATVAA